MRLARIQARSQPPRRGVALVQWVLVLPVFAILVAGVVEFGRAIMVGQLVTAAAQEGCLRAAAHGSTEAAVLDHVRHYLGTAAQVAPSDVSVTVDVSSSPRGTLATARSRDLVTVTVSVPFSRVSSLPSTFLNAMPLTATSARRHE